MDGYVVFNYCSNGYLIAFESYANLTDIQRDRLIANFPFKEASLKAILRDRFKFVLLVIPEDLSFKRFWDLYAYKVGNKKRAERLWSLLLDEDKAYILIVDVPRYKAKLASSTTAQAHADTYLNQERWKNEL